MLGSTVAEMLRGVGRSRSGANPSGPPGNFLESDPHLGHWVIAAVADV